MSVNRFKRQKVVRDAAFDTSRLLGAVYEPPEESLINFPSSIVNGITKEGGLASLTLKSVAAAKVVEESTWIHEVLFKNSEEPTRIIGKPEDLEAKISAIKSDIAELNNSKPSKKTVPELDEISTKLTNKASTVDSTVLAKEVHKALANFHTIPPLGDHLFSFVPKETAVTFDVKVDSAAGVVLPLEPVIEDAIVNEILRNDLPTGDAAPPILPLEQTEEINQVPQADDLPVLDQQVDVEAVPQSLEYLGF